MAIGNDIEAKLMERGKDNRPLYRLTDLLDDSAPVVEQSQYKSLALSGKPIKKVKINPDGTW